MGMDFYEKELNIAPEIAEFVNEIQEQVKMRFEEIDRISEYHQARILHFMNKCQISQRHFIPSNGYGYGDDGRDTLDKLFAFVFGSEDALVRPQWVSGTHVLGDGLFALLRPGDTMLSLTGKPYDTLDDVIGLGKNPACGSLREWGIRYQQIELLPDGKIDMGRLSQVLEEKQIKLAFIQRSRGYSWRPTIPVDEIRTVIEFIKAKSPSTMIMVDNCYGEFTERFEPSHFGADLVVGSLIKNPGGGLAPTGAYAVGRRHAIELLANRLTTPGIGREVGSFPSSYAPFYQGLFMAPHIVSQAVKGAILAAKIFETLGYEVLPRWNSARSDIIQSIQFRTAEELIVFCQGIQSASPVDSQAVPYPWDMPGYTHQVIMAAGTFVQGASIELSADAPIKEPYIAYLQGGLTYSHVKFAMMKVLTNMAKKNYIEIPRKKAVDK